MKLSDQEKALVAAMSEWEIIDCHEHLSPESARLDQDVDVFTLFAHYTRGDLAVAGMSQEDYDSLFNRNIPLQVRWKTFRPYWNEIRWTSYSLAALLSAQRFFDVDDINDDTYEQISAAIQTHNIPGLYLFLIHPKDNFAPHHQPCQVCACYVLGQETGRGHPPLLKHGHAVGDVHDLVQLVTDKDDRLALRGHGTQSYK